MKIKIKMKNFCKFHFLKKSYEIKLDGGRFNKNATIPLIFNFHLSITVGI